MEIDRILLCLWWDCWGGVCWSREFVVAGCSLRDQHAETPATYRWSLTPGWLTLLSGSAFVYNSCPFRLFSTTDRTVRCRCAARFCLLLLGQLHQSSQPLPFSSRCL